MSARAIGALAVFASFAYLFNQAGCTLVDFRPHPVAHSSDPINSSQDPIQLAVAAAGPDFIVPIERTVEGRRVHLLPQAMYLIAGRVLSAQRYYMNWESKLSPLDLAIGWEKFATPEYDASIRFDHGNRFYHWRRRSSPSVPSPDYVVRHTSNNHLIAATSTVERTLKSIRIGESIELSGLLVNIAADGGYHWNTSLRRDDTGGGSCEVLYVQKVRIGDAVYE